MEREMILRALIAALAIWGMTWSKDASAVLDDGAEQCSYGSTSVGDMTLPQLTCWYVHGYGGGGGYYNPDPGFGGGGGTNPYETLPPKQGYFQVADVYVSFDRETILADHKYSCGDAGLGVVAGRSGRTTRGDTVSIILRGGARQTWMRTDMTSAGWESVSPCR